MQITVAPRRTLIIRDTCVAEVHDSEGELVSISSILSQQVLYGHGGGGVQLLGGGITLEIPSSRLVLENTHLYLACESLLNQDFSFRNVSLVRQLRHPPTVLCRLHGGGARACKR